ncbi:hypothetical protein NHQ30_007228 [Ciborinia camelliae]|nr:hypothetical protein NHQ30_007228 [Ciborinia camelliae]
MGELIPGEKGAFHHALIMFNKVLQIQERSCGQSSREYAMSLVGLASIYAEFPNRLSLAKETVSMPIHIFNALDQRVMVADQILAMILFKQGDYDGAEIILKEVYEYYKKLKGESYGDTISTRSPYITTESDEEKVQSHGRKTRSIAGFCEWGFFGFRTKGSQQSSLFGEVGVDS